MSKKPLPPGQNDISNSHLLGLKACEAIENVKLLKKKKIQFNIKISFVQVLPLRQQGLEYVRANWSPDRDDLPSNDTKT